MSAIDLVRSFPDPCAGDLPPLVLDRQRIVHCAAFRRLQHKTQVFVAPESDHFRTRLTHTLEVAHLARCIADRLGLNPDLAEVVALAHDLGHPPFGHAGEQALNDCLRQHGGFEHNGQTLRIVEELEHPYPEFHGLNLTRAVRECLAKHSTPYDQPGTHPLQDGRPPPPEGLVVDLADRLAYALHDLQDGLYAGLLRPADLHGVELWRQAYAGPPAAWHAHLRGTIDRIQGYWLADLADQAGRSAEAPRLSPARDRELAQLEQFLLDHVYRSPALLAADEQARCILTAVFAACLGSPAVLPPRFAARIPALGPHRVVADYVAGMTDRFCLEQHARLCELGMPPREGNRRGAADAKDAE
jgi:dGTPase